MKRYIFFIIIAFSFLILPNHAISEEQSARIAYVIPIKGMIERGLLYVIRRAVDQAIKNDAEAIILDMDTPGGRVDAAEEIIRIFIELPESIHTYTFINKDALSAGSMIAVATDDIYMAPGSRIGASAIVTMTGDIKEGDLKEKHVSALVALVRNAAEHNGHDPELIESMIRKKKEYKIGDEVICPEGELLTLNDLDATRLVTRNSEREDKKTEKTPLLAAGTAKNMEELLVTIGLEDAEMIKVTLSTTERIARIIEALSILLLGGGLLCIFIEFKIPGFGVFGILGMALLALFFWGHHIAGLSGSFELFLFVAGAMLLALEIFVIPGFGAAGISGITLIVLALLMSMVEHYPGTHWFKPPEFQIQTAFRNLGLALAIAFGLGLILSRILPKAPGFSHLILASSLKNDENTEDSETTYSKESVKSGTIGSAATKLHPAGLGIFDGKRVNVVARGSFIDKGTSIIVAEKHGNRIVVDVMRDTETTES